MATTKVPTQDQVNGLILSRLDIITERLDRIENQFAGTKIIKVKATREGLVGGTTASGYVVDRVVPFVALPSTKALQRFLRVTNPANGKSTMAIVLDVGPWNEHDDAYVLNGARPQAETGTDRWGRPTNGAGIDLGELVWTRLGMTGNTDVEWVFL